MWKSFWGLLFVGCLRARLFSLSLASAPCCSYFEVSFIPFSFTFFYRMARAWQQPPPTQKCTKAAAAAVTQQNSTSWHRISSYKRTNELWFCRRIDHLLNSKHMLPFENGIHTHDIKKRIKFSMQAFHRAHTHTHTHIQHVKLETITLVFPHFLHFYRVNLWSECISTCDRLLTWKILQKNNRESEVAQKKKSKNKRRTKRK